MVEHKKPEHMPGDMVYMGGGSFFASYERFMSPASLNVMKTFDQQMMKASFGTFLQAMQFKDYWCCLVLHPLHGPIWMSGRNLVKTWDLHR